MILTPPHSFSYRVETFSKEGKTFNDIRVTSNYVKESQSRPHTETLIFSFILESGHSLQLATLLSTKVIMFFIKKRDIPRDTITFSLNNQLCNMKRYNHLLIEKATETMWQFTEHAWNKRKNITNLNWLVGLDVDFMVCIYSIMGSAC